MLLSGMNETMAPRRHHTPQENAERKAQWSNRAAAGVCVDCGATPLQTLRRCQSCADQRVKLDRLRRERRSAAGLLASPTAQANADAGLCIRCGGPRDSDYRTCSICRGKSKHERLTVGAALESSRKAQGLCVRCGDPAVPGTTMCERHLVATRDRTRLIQQTKRTARKAAGLCQTCTDRAVPGLVHCAVHHVWRLLYAYTGVSPSPEFVDAVLDKYDGKCAYTGETIPIGKTGELEHIYPRRLFPALAGEVTNIVWAHTRINHAKDDMDPRDPALVTFLPEESVLRIWDLASKVVGAPTTPFEPKSPA